MVNSNWTYSYLKPSIILKASSSLSVAYGEDSVKAKLVFDREVLNPYSQEGEMIRNVSTTSYTNGRDYASLKDGNLFWNEKYESSFVLSSFSLDSYLYSEFNIEENDNTFIFSGNVSNDKTSAFIGLNSTINDVKLNVKFDTKLNHVVSVESSFLTEMGATVSLKSEYFYMPVSVTIPEQI